MWQTKYAAAIPKNLGLGLNFWPCSEGYFLSGRPQSVLLTILSPFLVLDYQSCLLILMLTFLHVQFEIRNSLIIFLNGRIICNVILYIGAYLIFVGTLKGKKHIVVGLTSRETLALSFSLKNLTSCHIFHEVSSYFSKSECTRAFKNCIFEISVTKRTDRISTKNLHSPINC